jgi:protein O-GlcNAc transferase
MGPGRDQTSGHVRAAHLLQQGLQFHERGELEKADGLYRAALQLDPLNSDALYLRAVVAMQSGKFDVALPLLEKVSLLRPNDAEVRNNLGVVLKELGRSVDAIVHFHKAIGSNPQFAEAHANLGAALRAENDLDGAMGCYRRALTLKPGHLGFMINQWNLLHARGYTAEAETILGQIVAIAPQDAESCNSIGKMLFDCKKNVNARRYFERAISLRPNFAEAWIYLGEALYRESRIDEARAALACAFASTSDDALRIRSAQFLPVVMGTADEVAASRARQQREFDALEAGPLSVAHPETEIVGTNFYLAYQGENDRGLQMQLARIYLRACPSLGWVAPHCASAAKRSGPVRIGFVSRGLSSGSVGFAVSGFISSLDHKNFWVAALGRTVSGDPVSESIRQNVQLFVDLPNGLAAARQAIASCELDILIYPDIGMEPFTYFLGFSRLAPVQCVMWGLGITTGIGTIDYFLSHAEVEAEDADQHYSERLVRLDTPSIPALPKPLMPERLKTRADFGLSEGAHLYVCPQSLFKLHPEFDTLALGILQRDPLGQLVLLEGEAKHWRELLEARFLRTMPQVADRVVFLQRLTKEDFRNLIALCEVMLDTPRVGGGMTTLDGFVAGTPVVTLPGRFMRSRFTAAWYRRIGVEDCIAASLGQYVDIATRLACDPSLRANVSDRISSSCGVLFEDRDAVKIYEDFFLSVAPRRA